MDGRAREKRDAECSTSFKSYPELHLILTECEILNIVHKRLQVVFSEKSNACERTAIYTWAKMTLRQTNFKISYTNNLISSGIVSSNFIRRGPKATATASGSYRLVCWENVLLNLGVKVERSRLKSTFPANSYEFSVCLVSFMIRMRINFRTIIQISSLRKIRWSCSPQHRSMTRIWMTSVSVLSCAKCRSVGNINKLKVLVGPTEALGT